MCKLAFALLIGVLSSATALAVFAFGDTMPQSNLEILPQNVDQATLERYHHTDQGTRIMPAAFLAALRTADGISKLMSPDSMRKWGFITDGVVADKLNPFGWPIGFTVSDPKITRGIPVAGITCAACHTGEIRYKRTAIRIDGGQAYVDVPAFQAAVFAAIEATAENKERRAAFYKDAIAAGYPANRVEGDFQTAVAIAGKLIYGQKGLTGPIPGPGRVDAVQGIANAVFATALDVPSNARNFDAPVNYPYLWDIWRLSWLQYNAFLPPLPDSRNIGETLGTSGKTNIVDPKTGVLNPEPQRWQTSIQIKNLMWMESVLKRLKAPVWPEKVLGPIDQTKARQGRQLFATNCAGCHGIKVLPSGMWDVTVVRLSHIGTDPNQAVAWVGHTYDASKLGLSKTTHAVQLAGLINDIRKSLYAEDNVPVSKQESDISFEAPCGYKARPLVGVWATPPFLHNGSVRTIYDLISDARPTSFRYGSKEYDPVKLGYSEEPSADSRILDTSISGNRNTGHWWTNDTKQPGRIGRKLSEGEKYSIIEYLKAATYENYPTIKVAKEQPLPCSDQKNWMQDFAAR